MVMPFVLLLVLARLGPEGSQLNSAAKSFGRCATKFKYRAEAERSAPLLFRDEVIYVRRLSAIETCDETYP